MSKKNQNRNEATQPETQNGKETETMNGKDAQSQEVKLDENHYHKSADHKEEKDMAQNSKDQMRQTEGIDPTEMNPQIVLDRIKEIVESGDPKYTLGHEIDHTLFELMEQTRDPKNNLEYVKKEVTERLPQILQVANSSHSLFDAISTHNRIKIGIILENLNTRMKGKGKKGEGIKSFCESIGISNRSAGRYMRLAKFDDVLDYSYLGIERLTILIQNLERSGYQGGLGEFINTYNIDFDPREEPTFSVDEFRNKIATAALIKLDETENWGVGETLLKKFAIKKEGTVDYNGLIKVVETLRTINTKPSEYFENYVEENEKAKEFKGMIKALVKMMEKVRKEANQMKDRNISDSIGVTPIEYLIQELEKLKNQIKKSRESK